MIHVLKPAFSYFSIVLGNSLVFHAFALGAFLNFEYLPIIPVTPITRSWALPAKLQSPIYVKFQFILSFPTILKPSKETLRNFHLQKPRSEIAKALHWNISLSQAVE